MVETALLHMERHRCPILGICFGMQVMAASYGGVVESMRCKIHGHEWVAREPGASSHLLPDGWDTCQMVASHQDRVSSVPMNFAVTSRSPDGTIQSMEDCAHQRYGVQFHPEGNRAGHRILRRFIARCTPRQAAGRPT